MDTKLATSCSHRSQLTCWKFYVRVTLFARIGGDEFVVLLNDISSDSDFVPLLERLLLAASHPVTIDSVVMKVSASIGVAIYPDDNIKDADQLLQKADQAMYQAKQTGKNRYNLFVDNRTAVYCPD